jgi:hypothetical protein
MKILNCREVGTLFHDKKLVPRMRMNKLREGKKV